MDKKHSDGLKRTRSGSDQRNWTEEKRRGGPEKYCKNCKCYRYNPCNCQKGD